MPKDCHARKNERAERRKDPLVKRNADIERIVASREGMRSKWGEYKLNDPSPKRERALEDLEDAAETLEVAGWKIEPDLQKAFKMEMDERLIFENAIGKAINAGLLDHPLVRDWISNQRNFGEWDILRRFKRVRLEKGVKHPPTKEEFWVRFEAQSLSDEGKGPQEIRRILIRKLWNNNVPDFFGYTKPELKKLRKHLAGMSRQGFRQKLIRLGWRPPQKKT